MARTTSFTPIQHTLICKYLFSKNLDSVEVASTFHKGSYATISAAYVYIMKWIEEKGYVMTDTPRESQIDGIWNKESEEDWLTEVQIPVKKK